MEPQVFRRQEMSAAYAGAVSAVFPALCRTLAFRRWQAGSGLDGSEVPRQTMSYRYQTGSVRRSGRVVEVVRPLAITLKEVLNDPPCRVILTMRWRVEPAASGCTVRLAASYRLDRAAVLRRSHWDERLRLNFRNQFTFLATNLARMQLEASGSDARVPKRDLRQA
jgi:hypothetical protein